MSVIRPASVAVMAGVLALAGCAGFSADGGLARVNALSAERLPQAPQLRRPGVDAVARSARASALLARPLEVDDAVELALQENPALRADLNGLWVAEADLVQAGRLRNPGLSYMNVQNREGDYKIERAILFDALGLLTLPLRQGIEQTRFEQAQLHMAARTVSLASEVRRAWFKAVAGAQLHELAGRVTETAAIASTLARRLAAAGHLSPRARLQEQVFHAEAAARQAQAARAAERDREALTRLLGLEDPTAMRLPTRLPDLPADLRSEEGLAQLALRSRLDILQARHQNEALARALNLSRVTRFVNVLDAGYANLSEAGGARKNGYEINLELPLFDFGDARRSRAEALYQQSLAQTARRAVDALSVVRERHAERTRAHALARLQRDELLPLRERITHETLLRYNGMIDSVFDLLTEARAQIVQVTQVIETQRDFWLADTDLHQALVGGDADLQ